MRKNPPVRINGRPPKVTDIRLDPEPEQYDPVKEEEARKKRVKKIIDEALKVSTKSP